MGKNKARYNPNKPQNKLGNWCSYCDEANGKLYCERGWDTDKCKGNPHNCIKVLCNKIASKSDKQKNSNDYNVLNNKHY